MSNNLSASEVCKKLDQYVIGQVDAKKTLSIALRNRYRHENIKDEELRKNTRHKNVILIGSTGVGKTELSKWIAKIQKVPFVKVEATQFTEVGYVGTDVESIVRDLIEASIRLEKERMSETPERKKKEKEEIEGKILQIISERDNIPLTDINRKDLSERLEKGEFDNMIIEIMLPDKPNKKGKNSPFNLDMASGQAIVSMLPLGDIFGKPNEGKPQKLKKITVKDAMKRLWDDARNKLENDDLLIDKALEKAEKTGIVFIDEIDKLISANKSSNRGDVSREGVQRDLLPIVDGTVINTKHGPIKTNNILFICAGAFESAKPSDLLPELQGRFPIVAKLKNLTKKDFEDILTKTKFNLVEQYKGLLDVDNVDLDITKSGISQIAAAAEELNTLFNNIGARRLYAVMEKVVEELSFNSNGNKKTKVTIDDKYVKQTIKDLYKEDKAKKDNYII